MHVTNRHTNSVVAVSREWNTRHSRKSGDAPIRLWPYIYKQSDSTELLL